MSLSVADLPLAGVPQCRSPVKTGTSFLPKRQIASVLIAYQSGIASKRKNRERPSEVAWTLSLSQTFDRLNQVIYCLRSLRTEYKPGRYCFKIEKRTYHH